MVLLGYTPSTRITLNIRDSDLNNINYKLFSYFFQYEENQKGSLILKENAFPCKYRKTKATI